MSVEIKELNVITTIVNKSDLEKNSVIELEQIIERMLREHESRKNKLSEYDR